MAQDTAHMPSNAPSEHTAEQQPSGPGHCTRNTTHQAGIPLNKSQVAKDTAQTTQHGERPHR